jgi:hypothetical protein
MNTRSIYVEPFSYFDEQHVRDVLELHPADCIFELDAPRKIAERLSSKTVDWWIKMENREEFKKCFTASEVYCPHEGIDRLAECGVQTLDWELA